MPQKFTPAACSYNVQKSFGADVSQKCSMNKEAKLKWKPDSNPPPGLYNIEQSMSLTKPSIQSARTLQDKSKRSDFTASTKKENPAGANYDIVKPFGSEVQNRLSFGGRHYTKQELTPAPGLYDPNLNSTRPTVTNSVNLNQSKSKRGDFTN